MLSDVVGACRRVDVHVRPFYFEVRDLLHGHKFNLIPALNSDTLKQGCSVAEGIDLVRVRRFRPSWLPGMTQVSVPR